MQKLQALSKRLDQFLHKQDSQNNEELRLLIQDSAYVQFVGDMEHAIYGQATWTAAQLKTLSDQYITEDLEALSTNQQQQLQQYLLNNMPKVGDSVTTEALAVWFKQTFEVGATDVYKNNGIDTAFSLRSPAYLATINSQADYLLNKSSLDDTTRNSLINLIAKDKEAGMTVPEIAKDITDTFADIAKSRADMIAYTETASMYNRGQYSAMKESGVMFKEWVPLGDPCATICLPNSEGPMIPMDAVFDSGDLMPPAHPRCECVLDYQIADLTAAEAWDGE